MFVYGCSTEKAPVSIINSAWYSFWLMTFSKFTCGCRQAPSIMTQCIRVLVIPTTTGDMFRSGARALGLALAWPSTWPVMVRSALQIKTQVCGMASSPWSVCSLQLQGVPDRNGPYTVEHGLNASPLIWPPRYHNDFLWPKQIAKHLLIRKHR